MARHGTVSQDTKIKPDKSRVEFMAERIGLEPMDRKIRSQISNLLPLVFSIIFYNRLQQKARDF